MKTVDFFSKEEKMTTQFTTTIYFIILIQKPEDNHVDQQALVKSRFTRYRLALGGFPNVPGGGGVRIPLENNCPNRTAPSYGHLDKNFHMVKACVRHIISWCYGQIHTELFYLLPCFGSV